MGDILAAVLLPLCLVGIMLFIVNGARLPVAARNVRGFSSYRSPSAIGGSVSGLVAALAVSTATNLAQAGGGTSVSVGAAVGVLFAILGAVGSATILRIALGVFGAVGVLGGIGGAVVNPSCSVIPESQRVVVLLVLFVAAGIGIVLSLLRGTFHPHSILGIFSAGRMVTFLASPFGVSLLELPWGAWILALGSAIIFGLIAGIAPDLVIGLAAVAIAFASIAVGATIGTACSVGGQPDDLGVLVGYAACYLITRIVAKGIFRR